MWLESWSPSWVLDEDRRSRIQTVGIGISRLSGLVWSGLVWSGEVDQGV